MLNITYGRITILFAFPKSPWITNAVSLQPSETLLMAFIICHQILVQAELLFRSSLQLYKEEPNLRH